MVTGLIVLISAVLVVLGTSLLKHCNWSVARKTAIASALSAVGGIVTVLATNEWNVNNFATADVLETVILVYGSAQLIYNFIIKGFSAIDNNVNAPLERAFSGGPTVSPNNEV